MNKLNLIYRIIKKLYIGGRGVGDIRRSEEEG